MIQQAETAERAYAHSAVSGLRDKTPTCGHNRGTPKARHARFGEPPTTPYCAPVQGELS